MNAGDAGRNHQQTEVDDVIEGLSVVEKYFQEVRTIENEQQSRFLNFAKPISAGLVVLGYALMLFLQPFSLFLGTVSILIGLVLFLCVGLMEGREVLQILSNVPVAHMRALKCKAQSLTGLRNNLAKLDVNAQRLLHVSLKNQKEYTHNINKLMLGDLGFIPTTLLGVSSALTLKTLFAFQTNWVSIAIMFIAFITVLSFVGFYVRDSAEGYQKVIDVLESVIDQRL